MEPSEDGKINIDLVLKVRARISNAMDPAEAKNLTPEQVAIEVLGWHGGYDFGALDEDMDVRLVKARRTP